MASLLTIPVVVSCGDVSTYLSDNDNKSGALFGKRLSAPISPVTILMATDGLRWGTEKDIDGTIHNTATSRQVANYCVWLYGKYGQAAQYIISGTGGGSIVPAPSSNLPLPLQFIVSSTSFIATGKSTATISQFIGFNLLFSRGSMSQSTVITEPSYYTWDRDTGNFTCSPAAAEGELYQLYAIG